jgi:hypothetical protein
MVEKINVKNLKIGKVIKLDSPIRVLFSYSSSSGGYTSRGLIINIEINEIIRDEHKNSYGNGQSAFPSHIINNEIEIIKINKSSIRIKAERYFLSDNDESKCYIQRSIKALEYRLEFRANKNLFIL